MARPAEALTSFLKGNGALYWCQHSGWAAESMVPNRLEIKSPPYGAIVACGPAARYLAIVLCAGFATLIQASGAKLTSVRFLRTGGHSRGVGPPTLGP